MNSTPETDYYRSQPATQVEFEGVNIEYPTFVAMMVTEAEAVLQETIPQVREAIFPPQTRHEPGRIQRAGAQALNVVQWFLYANPRDRY